MLNELQMIWDAVDRGSDQIGEDLWKNSQPPRPDTLINQNVALVDPQPHNTYNMHMPSDLRTRTQELT